MSPQQLDLFAGPKARNKDRETSHEAARRAPNLEDVILEVIASYREGLTDDELCARLAEHYAPTVKSARSRLSKYGCLHDSGVRRLSLRNRSMVVWTMYGPEIEVVKLKGERL
jgi:hypothetical protein